jgi:hypothetical protein
MSVTEAKSILIDAINEGTALVSYVGHSGPASWTFSGLFSSDETAALSNHGAPTVVTQWGCWNTYFVDPAYNTMAHRFLVSGENGAAAVLGATTITYDTSERMLGHYLMPRLVEQGMTIGKAITKAKQELAATGDGSGLTDVILGWTLLGDPALVVQP